jgi:hypothetical protein
MVKSLGTARRSRPVLWAVLLVWTTTAAWAQSQGTPELPPAPQPQDSQTNPRAPEKKQEEENPESAAGKTRKMTVEAAQATMHIGEAAMVRARDWEASWLTGVFVPKGGVITPLTLEQRREFYLQQTLTTPGAYLKRVFAAGIDQARGVPSQWDDGWDGFSERFASREGQFITANSVAAVGNALLQYEPRYDQCQCSGLWPRTRHAIGRNFVTYNRSEQQLRPQWALYTGAFVGGVVATYWKPPPRNPLSQGGYAMLGQAGYGALLNFFIEFAGDINHKIGAKRRDGQKY